MSKLTKAFLGLFPLGAIDEEDTKTKKLITLCTKEFKKVNELLEAVALSVLNPGPLEGRWQRITDAVNPRKKLSAKGFAVGKWSVSNNKDHLRSLHPHMSFERNHITVTGLKNEVTHMTCGIQIGTRLATFDRDEDTIKLIEKTRHAHTTIKYEVSNA